MNEFLSMGGYAVYVWPSFGLTFAFLLWAFVAPWRRHRQVRARLRREAGR